MNRTCAPGAIPPEIMRGSSNQMHGRCAFCRSSCSTRSRSRPSASVVAAQLVGVDAASSGGAAAAMTPAVENPII
jgi:hypothetical protein